MTAGGRDWVDDVEVVAAVAAGFVIGVFGFGLLALAAVRRVVQK